MLNFLYHHPLLSSYCMLTVLRSIGECAEGDTPSQMPFTWKKMQTPSQMPFTWKKMQTTDLIRELDANAKCQTMAYYCVCEPFTKEQMIRGMCCDSNGKCDCCRQDPTILKMPPLLQHHEPTLECEALLISPSQLSYCAWSEGASATACCKRNYKFVPLKREQIGGGLLWFPVEAWFLKEERNHAKCLGLPKLEQRQPLPDFGEQERNAFVCAAKVYTVPRLSSTVKNEGFASVALSATSTVLIVLASLIMHSAFLLLC